MGDAAADGALQVQAPGGIVLSKLAPGQLTQDVRRERASLDPSPFGWNPVWNRTQLTSYFHNRSTNATRFGDSDSRGNYRIIHCGGTAVHSKVNSIKEGDVATLWQNASVEVLAVLVREDVKRIRARIKSPPGWITLQNLETNYRFAVKADSVILISGVDGAPQVNGRYERDAHETDRGDGMAYPRFKQVNGDHYIRISYEEDRRWMITAVKSGPVGNQLLCDSVFYRDPRPLTVDSMPPTWPAAWRSAGRGLPEPMPSLSIVGANEGNVRRFGGKAFPVLGIIRLDYDGYHPDADETESYGAMGYSLLYRRISGVPPAALEAGLDAWGERGVIGAMQRLEQMGARGIVADAAALLACQPLAQSFSGRPPFLSALLQWPTVAAAHATSDRFLVLTNSERELRAAAELLQRHCQLDVAAERLVIRGCDAVPDLLAVKRGEQVPSERVEQAVLELARAAREEHQDLRGVLVESTELLPYTDALREALALPVWDAVCLCDLHYAARPEYQRFEVQDWMERLAFEIGRHEGRRNGGPRRLGVISLDYENTRVDKEWSNFGSQDYEACFHRVDGLTRYLASLGKLTKSCELGITEAVERFQELGVCGITGDCGFMMSYQVFTRDRAKVPVFMSPLMLGPAILSALDPRLQIMIITADAELLRDQKARLKELKCIDLGNPRFTLVGCETFAGMERLGKKGEIAEMASVLPTVCGIVQKSVEEWPSLGVHVGAIIVECMHLMPVSELLRKETGLPVYDAISCCEFFASARHDYDRFGIKQWPYAWDRSVEEE